MLRELGAMKSTKIAGNNNQIEGGLTSHQAECRRETSSASPSPFTFNESLLDFAILFLFVVFVSMFLFCVFVEFHQTDNLGYWNV